MSPARLRRSKSTLYSLCLMSANQKRKRSFYIRSQISNAASTYRHNWDRLFINAVMQVWSMSESMFGAIDVDII